jgi:hypothetical protein
MTASTGTPISPPGGNEAIQPPFPAPAGVHLGMTSPVLDYGRPMALYDPARRPPSPFDWLRQFAFAAGLACVLGGFAYGLSPSTGRGEVASAWAAIGGGLIGLAFPLRRIGGR